MTEQKTTAGKAGMTSKERAGWRAQANELEPIVYIGKGGVTDSVAEQTAEALTAHELVKARVLETSPVGARAAAQTLAAALGAEIIQVIGRVFVLYRESEEKREKERKKAEEQARIRVELRRKKAREAREAGWTRSERPYDRPAGGFDKRNGGFSGRKSGEGFRQGDSTYRGKAGSGRGRRSRNGR